MAVNRKQEIWALALWVERTHGEHGGTFIAERIAHFEEMDARQAATLWERVARRYEQLTQRAPRSD